MFTAHRALIEDAYRRQELGEVLMLIAEADGFPVGQVWLDFTREDKARAGYVWAFRVMPGFKNAGIGAALMQGAEDALRDRGFAYVRLAVEKNNLFAIRFYERAGFERIGAMEEEIRFRTPFGRDEVLAFDEWMYQKALGPCGDHGAELSPIVGAAAKASVGSREGEWPPGSYGPQQQSSVGRVT